MQYPNSTICILENKKKTFLAQSEYAFVNPEASLSGIFPCLSKLLFKNTMYADYLENLMYAFKGI
jgi:hypothetical protein